MKSLTANKNIKLAHTNNHDTIGVSQLYYTEEFFVASFFIIVMTNHTIQTASFARIDLILLFLNSFYYSTENIPCLIYARTDSNYYS